MEDFNDINYCIKIHSRKSQRTSRILGSVFHLSQRSRSFGHLICQYLSGRVPRRAGRVRGILLFYDFVLAFMQISKLSTLPRLSLDASRAPGSFFLFTSALVSIQASNLSTLVKDRKLGFNPIKEKRWAFLFDFGKSAFPVKATHTADMV